MFFNAKLPTRSFQPYITKAQSLVKEYAIAINNTLNILIMISKNSSEHIHLQDLSQKVLLLLMYNRRRRYSLHYVLYTIELNFFDKITCHQADFMHFLSDKVLLRYYESQYSSSESGNLELASYSV